MALSTITPSLESNSILLTVLFPCLNEEKTIGDCIDQAQDACKTFFAKQSLMRRNLSDCQSLTTYEILVADNGSTDNSVSIAKSKGVRVVQISEKGYGAAILGGIQSAMGTYTIMADCDGSYNIYDLERFVNALQDGFDLVVGNRFAGGIEDKAMPWHHRYIGNPALSFLGRIIYRVPCRDWHCGIRAFNTNAMQSLGLRSKGMELASEMLVMASKTGLRTKEIPTVLRPDNRGRKPHLRSFRDGFRHLSLLLRNMSNRQLSVAFSSIAVLLFVSIGLFRSGAILSANSELSHLKWVEAHEVSIKDFIEGESVNQSVNVFISNELHRPLRLRKMDLGCTCLKANLVEDLLPPDGANLEVSLKAVGKPGPFSQRIVLHFEDESKNIFQRHIFLRGNIISTIHHTPDSIDFGEIRLGAKNSPYSRVIRTIVPTGGKATLTTKSPRLRISTAPKPDEIESPNNSTSNVSKLKEEIDPAMSSYHLLELQISPDTEPGHYRDEVFVTLDSELLSTNILPVIYNVSSLVRTTPSRILLSDLKRGEMKTVTVYVDLLSDEVVVPPRITSQLGEEVVRTTVRETETGLEIRITVHYNGDAEFLSDRIFMDFGEFSHEIPIAAKVVSLN